MHGSEFENVKSYFVKRLENISYDLDKTDFLIFFSIVENVTIDCSDIN